MKTFVPDSTASKSSDTSALRMRMVFSADFARRQAVLEHRAQGCAVADFFGDFKLPERRPHAARLAAGAGGGGGNRKRAQHAPVLVAQFERLGGNGNVNRARRC